MLRLSIIVNMYNTAKYMDRCMDTLLNQDIPLSDYEIILVDDCSPDNSLEMANEYAVKYPNIKVLHHKTNRGLAAGRNTGVDAAEGQYLCFVDPDDYIEKNSLATLLNQMDDEKLDVLRFNYQKVDEEYRNVEDSYGEKKFDYSSDVISGNEFLTKRLGIQCYVWAYIYRTSLIKSNLQSSISDLQSPIRFIEGIYYDDTPWLPRVLMQTKRLKCIPIRHQFYMQRKGSLVHTNNLESIRRKIDGQMAMIKVLQSQMVGSSNDVEAWYHKMLSHTAMSVLCSIAPHNFKATATYYQQLNQWSIFPLTPSVAPKKMIIKMHLLNRCPYGLFALIRILHFIKP